LSATQRKPERLVESREWISMAVLVAGLIGSNELAGFSERDSWLRTDFSMNSAAPRAIAFSKSLAAATPIEIVAPSEVPSPHRTREKLEADESIPDPKGRESRTPRTFPCIKACSRGRETG